MTSGRWVNCDLCDAPCDSESALRIQVRVRLVARRYGQGWTTRTAHVCQSCLDKPISELAGAIAAVAAADSPPGG